MIAKIIELSARNRFAVFLMMALAIVWGYWAVKNTPLDALPDLSDTQVIIYTEWAGRSPDLVEDQITYPITSTLLAAPKVQAGRAETATDPAPLEMFETVINLKPEEQWRKGMTVEKLKDEMNDALTIPGVANSFTMPIKARIDMLATGIRTPVGIKILGPDLEEIEKIGIALEHHLKDIPGTRSVYAERVTTGYFLDIAIKREEAARYGLTVDDVGEVIQAAIGGMNLTVTVEGRARYPVNVRYPRNLRSDVEQLKRILVPVMTANRLATAPAGAGGMAAAPPLTQIPLGEVAEFKVVKGPTAIKSEE